MTAVAADGELSVFVHDRALWRKHRQTKPLGSQGSKLYAISRNVLFHRAEAWKERRIFSLKQVMKKLGVE